jgi:hypothetical protein
MLLQMFVENLWWFMARPVAIGRQLITLQILTASQFLVKIISKKSGAVLAWVEPFELAGVLRGRL